MTRVTSNDKSLNSAHVAYVNSEHVSDVNIAHVSGLKNSDVPEVAKIRGLGITRVPVGLFRAIFSQMKSHQVWEAYGNHPAAENSNKAKNPNKKSKQSENGLLKRCLTHDFSRPPHGDLR